VGRMKRRDVLAAIRQAGYHGDRERAILLYVQNWVSLHAYAREYDAGAAMRQSGVPCECFRCKRRTTGAAWPPFTILKDAKRQTAQGGLPLQSNLN
jgi:hypothetical protein